MAHRELQFPFKTNYFSIKNDMKIVSFHPDLLNNMTFTARLVQQKAG